MYDTVHAAAYRLGWWTGFVAGSVGVDVALGMIPMCGAWRFVGLAARLVQIARGVQDIMQGWSAVANGNSWGWLQIGGGVLSVLSVLSAAKDITRLGSCFTADTKVVVGGNAIDGYETRNIGELRAGDLVATKLDSDAGDDVELRRVLAVHEKTTDHLRFVSFLAASGDTETITTTDEHPFFVLGRGWQAAGSLALGDLVMTIDGSFSRVTTTRREEHPEGVKVYNLTVEGDHTFFVDGDADGVGALWVHNVSNNPLGDMCCGSGASNIYNHANLPTNIFARRVDLFARQAAAASSGRLWA